MKARITAVLVFAVVATAVPAEAQIGRLSGVTVIGTKAQLGGFGIKGSDIAYDPQNDVYLVVTGFFAPVQGVFVDRLSNPVSEIFTVGSGPSNFPRVRYSPHLNGGQGGFLVAWAVEGPGGNHSVRTRVVSYPGTLSGQESTISEVSSPPWLEAGPAIGYSPVSQRFLIAWQTYPMAQNPTLQIASRLVDLTGAGVGAVARLSSGFGSNPSVAWNSAHNEFGVSFTTENASGSMSFTAISRVSVADGSMISRETFNANAGLGFITDLDYNPDTNRYVVAWYQQPFGGGPEMRMAELDAAGNLTSTGLVSSLLWGMNSLSVAFNPVSRTFLLSSLDNNDAAAGVELNSRGYPNSPRTVLVNGVTTRYNRSSPVSTRKEWGITFSDFYAQLKGFIAHSTSAGGGSGGEFGGGAPSPTPTPPPTPTPTPTPTPAPGGCATAAPASDWVCNNGNWYPAGYFGESVPAPAPPPPPPPPPPATSTCTTPAPASDWVCVGDGWLPAGFPGAPQLLPTPPSGDNTCTTAAPASDWVCRSGDWLPAGFPGAPVFQGGGGGGGGGGSVGCTGAPPAPDWVCLNGGWVPSGYPGTASSCIGGDPFVGLPGISHGICVNGNWLPVASGAPAPVAAPESLAAAARFERPASAVTLDDPRRARSAIAAA